MHAASPPLSTLLLHRPRWLLRGVVAALATMAGVTSLDVQQRKWIFQAGLYSNAARSQGSAGMQDQWIPFQSEESGAAVTLHGLWLPQARTDAPVLLFLHGARWDIRGSAQRMRGLHELGSSVLDIDYRGFGQSTAALPSERMACEDACAAWRWLARQHPQAQRFDSAQRIHQVKVPTLVVHGSADHFIRPELGRALYERVTSAKRFMLVQGGSHHDTHAVGRTQYREALRDLFGLMG